MAAGQAQTDTSQEPAFDGQAVACGVGRGVPSAVWSTPISWRVRVSALPGGLWDSKMLA